MATIGEITQAASYRGDPALGGAGALGFTLDPSPLARMAQFTFYKDRDKWMQNQKNKEDAAKRIAAIAAFDTNSPLKGYADDLRKGAEDIKTYVRDNPNALRYDKDPEGFQELIFKIGEWENKRKKATANDALYNSAKASAESIVDPATRADNLELLGIRADELFANGIDDAYNRQFLAAPEINPNTYKIPKVPMTQAFDIKYAPNSVVINGKQYADLDVYEAGVEGAFRGLTVPSVKDSPGFQKLSESQKRQALLEERGRNSTLTGLQSTAATVDSLVKEFQAKNPNKPISTMTPAELSAAGSVGAYISLANKYNEQVRELNKLAGKNYKEINLDDGASAVELMKLQGFGDNGEVLYKQLEPKFIQTDNSIQLGQLAETIRHNKAQEQDQDDLLNFNKEKWTEATTGGETVKNGAMIRATRILEDLRKLSKFNNGIIGPDQIRKLTQEQLKYLGTNVVETSDTGVPRNVFKPLEFDPKTEYAIQVFKDGRVMVMKPKDGETKLEVLDGGRKYVGLWDNTKSTNLTYVATNIVNEQLEKAGAKELNAYLPIDLGTGGVMTNTTGGGTRTGGGAATQNVQTIPRAQVPDQAQVVQGADGKFYYNGLLIQ